MPSQEQERREPAQEQERPRAQEQEQGDPRLAIWAPELSARFLGPFMDEIVNRQGEEGLTRFLDRWQITPQELRDETSWVSLRFCEQFVEDMVSLTGSTEILSEAARLSLSPRYFGFLYPFLRLFASPRALYGGLPDVSKRFNKVSDIRILSHTPNLLKVSYSPKQPRFREKSALICRTRKDQLSAGPTIWGLPFARVEELSCQARGDDACIYEIRWQNRVKGTWTALGLLSGAALGALAPASVPVAFALPVAGLCGLLLGRVIDQQKELRETSRFSSEQHGALRTSAQTSERRFHELQQAKAEVDRKVLERTTELREVNHKLAKANTDLKELDQLKSRFFANISHELRTPLTLILAPLEGMLMGEMGPMSPELQQQFQLLRRNALGLLKLINNLLDLSRLEEHRLRLRPRPMDLADFVAARVEAAEPLARREMIKLLFTASSSPMVLADEDKLEQVIVNLLSNALKFTEADGFVAVVVGETEETAWISVQDSGIGIPEPELPHIFDRFRQVDTSSTRRYGGTGIGLSLAKEMVDLHGGKLTVVSELGQGSTFTVNLHRLSSQEAALVERQQEEPSDEEQRKMSSSGSWRSELLSHPDFRFLEIKTTSEVELEAPPPDAVPPMDAAPHEPRPMDLVSPEVVNDLPLEQAPAGPEGEKPTILIVEDNVDMAQVLAQLLARRFRVLTAEDGEQGLQVARAELPALVLCDMMMPIMDGVTLCRELREDHRTAPIPVIMITARTASEDSVAALDAGADDFLSKPFSMRELLSRIGAQLRIRQLDQAVARAERMASLGSTAAGLAHEVRNALNPIINGLEALEFVEPEAQPELKRHMTLSAHRILETVEALKSFVRLDEVPFTELDLNAAIKDTLTLLSYRLTGIQVQTRLELTDPVQCYPATINQVLMNLLTNAADAAGEGGRLLIATAREGDRALVRVKDSGAGIAAEDRERIFYPYYTTKPVGQGTGMGLAMARQIVERHHGTLAVTSTPGEGAELTMALPLLAEWDGNNDVVL